MPAVSICFFFYIHSLSAYRFRVSVCLFSLFTSSASSWGSVVIIGRGGYLSTIQVLGSNRRWDSDIN
jgi:hypothetical protein